MASRCYCRPDIRLLEEGLARRLGVCRDAWAAVFLEVWRNKIIYFAPMLKDEAFSGEREWRLICTLSDEELGRLQLRKRQSLISRHMPLGFGDKLPIRRVMVGPCIWHPLFFAVASPEKKGGSG